MQTVYLVIIVPTKTSKGSYVLGLFDSLVKANEKGKIETTRADAYWWNSYTVTAMEIK